MNFIVSTFFGQSSATLVFSDGDISSYNLDPYNILNPLGSMSAVSIVSLGILFIALWWSYGNFSNADPSKTLATTSSSINSLSVVAFVLSWIPLTAIPANVLGHMAYDQVVDGKEPQRGIGLSRWAIILSYVSLIAGAVAIFNIWFD
jgi:Na+/melibiose symporter-like transporter